MRPGRLRAIMMERAVTLLPQPLSPTMPRVCPSYRSKLTPSTATTFPSSRGKWVARSRTDSRGSRATGAAPLLAVWVCCISDTVSHEVEGEHDDYYGYGRYEYPGRKGHRLDLLGLL